MKPIAAKLLLVLLGLGVASAWWYFGRPGLTQIFPLTKLKHRHASQVITADAVRRSAAGSVAALADVLQLEPGQECLTVREGFVGTVIVRGVVNGTPTVRQLIENGRPVKCIGDRRIE